MNDNAPRNLMEWWTAPVPGWPETLTIHNLASDQTVTIRLRATYEDEAEEMQRDEAALSARLARREARTVTK
ncbi:hypothetical protein WOC76_12465 [Methylocystis sp. IM3]|uniref:hypothetical protein n=1 Tax=unclassified Methylocystis TaxID=2625913 RepID=UPI0030F9C6C3